VGKRRDVACTRARAQRFWLGRFPGRERWVCPLVCLPIMVLLGRPRPCSRMEYCGREGDTLLHALSPSCSAAGHTLTQRYNLHEAIAFDDSGSTRFLSGDRVRCTPGLASHALVWLFCLSTCLQRSSKRSSNSQLGHILSNQSLVI
jgi:hypothetical protein